MTKAAPAITLQQEIEATLTAAVRKNLAAVKKSATIENLKKLTASEEKLKEFQAQQAAQDRPAERPLKNLTEVAAYLSEERGFKVSERKVYADKRLITCQTDGSYLVRDAEAYAAQFLQKKDGSDDEVDSGLSRVKIQKEIELQEEKISRERRRNLIETGKYILRSKVDQQLAARAAYLISDLEAFAHGKLPEVAEQALDSTSAPVEVADYLAELRAKIAPELCTVFLSEMRKWLDRYSQPLQFQAPMVGDIDLDDEDFEESDA
jgi:hypothetical protein